MIKILDISNNLDGELYQIMDETLNAGEDSLIVSKQDIPVLIAKLKEIEGAPHD